MRRTMNLLNITLALLVVSGCAGNAKTAELRDSEIAPDRPAAPRTLYTMARILVNQHREAEAEKLLNEAILPTPAYLPAFVALAELQLKHPDGADQALATLNKALAAAPGEALLHNNAGMCHLARKDYATALACFSRAAELDAADPRFRANRALALGMLGQYDECLAAYLTVLPPAEAHHNLAILCRLRGDNERAKSEIAESQRHGTAPTAPLSVESAAPRG